MRAKNKLVQAWERLDKMLQGGQSFSKNPSFVQDSTSRTRPTSSMSCYSSSVQVTRRERQQSRLSSQKSKMLSQSVQITFSSKQDDDLQVHPLLALKQQDGLLKLREIPVISLVRLFIARCEDNEIIPSKQKLATFLFQMDKRAKKRILDLSDLSLGLKSASLIAKIIRQDQHFLQLQLSGNNLGEKGWTKFGQILATKQNISLLHLDVSHCFISPQGCQSIIQALPNIITLVSLNISHNHMGLSGSRSLMEYLGGNSTLQYLDISSTQMGQGFQLVCQGLTKCESLLSIKLQNNSIDQKSLSLLTHSVLAKGKLSTDFLFELSLDRNPLRCGDELSLLLRWNEWKVMKLNLSSCLLNVKGFQKIGEALVQHEYLEYLNLSKNDFSGQGFEYMVHILQHNSFLRTLIISDCNIEPLGAYQISEGLQKNRALNHLDLSGNPISVKGSGFIARGLSAHKAMAIVDLSRCLIKDEGALDMFQTLKENQTIFSISVKNNFLTDLSLKELRSLIQTNKIITNVDYSLNLVNHKLECEIKEALTSNQQYQKKELIPRYMKKLQILGQYQQASEDLVQYEARLKMTEEIFERQLQEVKQKMDETKNLERTKMMQLEKKNYKKHEKLVELQKELDGHEIEQYRWKKNTEVDFAFYEKNLQLERALDNKYTQAIQLLQQKKIQLQLEMPKKIKDLQIILNQARIDYEAAQLRMENLQSDLDEIKRPFNKINSSRGRRNSIVSLNNGGKLRLKRGKTMK